MCKGFGAVLIAPVRGAAVFVNNAHLLVSLHTEFTSKLKSQPLRLDQLMLMIEIEICAAEVCIPVCRGSLIWFHGPNHNSSSKFVGQVVCSIFWGCYSILQWWECNSATWEVLALQCLCGRKVVKHKQKHKSRLLNENNSREERLQVWCGPITTM